MITVIN